MTKKEYAEVLKAVIKMQLVSVQEDLKMKDYDDEYLEGVVQGLDIALDKIEASMFLTEKE